MAEAIDSQPQEERWAYGGVRVDVGGKREYLWLPQDGRGKAVHFGKFHGQAVGEVYRVAVSRDEGGRVSVYGEPRYAADGRLDAEMVARLRAEHQAALTILALARQHRFAARRDELDEVIEPLRVIAARLTRPERTALIAYLITELTYPLAKRGGDRR